MFPQCGSVCLQVRFTARKQFVFWNNWSVSIIDKPIHTVDKFPNWDSIRFCQISTGFLYKFGVAWNFWEEVYLQYHTVVYFVYGFVDVH